MEGCQDMLVRLATCTASIGMGIFCGLAVAAYVTRRDPEYEEEPQNSGVDQERKREVRKFNEAWLDELDELGADDDRPPLSEITWHTPTYPSPYGKVAMRWSTEKEAFEYWTEEGHVPFPTLDALARRYAIAHSAPDICLNARTEFRKARQKAREEQKAASEAARDTAGGKAASIFAPLKARRRRGRKRISVLMEKNRFSYRGTLEDLEQARSEQSSNEKSFQPISFSEFKRRCSKDD